MPFCSVSKVLNKVTYKNSAIGAFNIHNMEFVQGVVKAAEKEELPIILMIAEPTIKYAGLEMLATICMDAADSSKVPVAVALDHGKTLEIIYKSIELGLSVMFDGSLLPIQENTRLTKMIVERAHKAGVSVEGELGCIAGTEDDITIHESDLTTPEAATEFVDKTGVDALAVAIGNQHGFYRKAPNLDISRLKAIKKRIEVPLVLHGGSDLPLIQIKDAINNGIKKVNIGTDLKYIFAKTLKDELNRESMPYNPSDFLNSARQAVERLAGEKIRQFWQ